MMLTGFWINVVWGVVTFCEVDLVFRGREADCNCFWPKGVVDNWGGRPPVYCCLHCVGMIRNVFDLIFGDLSRI